MPLFLACWEPWLVLQLYVSICCVLDDYAKTTFRIVNTG